MILKIVRIPNFFRTAATCFIAGCASEAPRIPENLAKSSAAVVRAWSPGDVRVEAIDGVEIGKVSHVYLAPGEHQITVRWAGPQNVTRTGQVRAIVQEIFTALLFAAKPRYMHWMEQAKRELQLRI